MKTQLSEMSKNKSFWGKSILLILLICIIVYGYKCGDIELSNVIEWIIIILAVYFGFYLNLNSETIKRNKLIDEVTEKLTLIPLKLVNNDGVIVDIYNPTSFIIHDASVYLTIENDEQDVISLVNNVLYPKGRKIENLQICWSKIVNGRNTDSRNIYPGEHAQLSICRTNKSITHQHQINLRFPSSEGFGNDSMAQFASQRGDNIVGGVELKLKEYPIELRLVSADTRGIIWKCKLKLTEFPVTILKKEIVRSSSI